MENCEHCGKPMTETGVCPCRCTNCSNIIFDPVLAYCYTFLVSNAVSEVAKAVYTFFNNEDITSARELLRKKYADRFRDLDICRINNRKSSTLRSVAEACANDIVEAVQLLLNGEDPPVFVTHDLRKLPLLQPQLANERDQAEHIRLMEKRLQRLEEKMMMTDDKLKFHDDKIRQYNETKSEGSLALPPPLPGFGRPNDKDYNAWSNNRPGFITSQLQTKSAAKSNPAMERTRGQHQLQSEQAAEQTDDDDQGEQSEWKNQKYQRKRERRKSQQGAKDESQMQRRRRPAGLQGAAEGTDVRAGPGANRDLWIYNVHKDMDDDALRKYIEEGGSKKERKINIRKWEPRYSPEFDSKRFRLTIAKSDYEYVYSSEFWPLDISVRKYWLSEDERKPKKNHQANNNGGS